jgi:hypothetical protein
MPSMKCYNCGKVKRCKMVTGHVLAVEYLCRVCLRVLGYVDEGGEA